ncbi:MAG: hypothetical protein AAB724_02360 [Patescibacteria group bacterium]
MINFKIAKEWFQKYQAVLIFAVIAGLAAGLSAWWLQPPFRASISLTVSRATLQLGSDYQYDNYYALKASDEFGDTVAGWFKIPEMTQEILKQAGQTGALESLSSLSRRFSAVKVAPNLVELRYGAASPTEALILGEAIKRVVTGKVDDLKQASNQSINFSVLAGPVVVANNSRTIWWQALAGLAAGLALGFFLKVSREYLS